MGWPYDNNTALAFGQPLDFSQYGLSSTLPNYGSTAGGMAPYALGDVASMYQPMAAANVPLDFSAAGPSNGMMAGFNAPLDGSPGTPPGAKPGFWGPDGFNIGTVGTIAQGAGALMGAYLGFKNYGLAKDQLNFTKEAFNANLNNSIKAYNNSLEDRIRGRTSEHAGKEAEDNAYLASHSMKR